MAEEPVVKVYSTETCPWCQRAREYLTEKGVKFEYIDVGKDREQLDEMIELSGQMAVPVIAIGKDYIIGFNQKELDAKLGLETAEPT